MQKIYGVREQEGLGDAVDNEKIDVVIQGWSDVESLAAAEVPGFLDVRIVVNDYWADYGSYWSGVKVEGTVEVFPGGHCR